MHDRNASGGHPPNPGPRAVLGLRLDATRTEAQRAFRRLAKQTHPDTGGDPAAFRAVAGAWAELAVRLPHERRRPARSPHAEAYRVPVSRVVWAEPRPSTSPIGAAAFSVALCRSRRHNATEKVGGHDFAAILRAEITRLAA
jgi:hypothetical protein